MVVQVISRTSARFVANMYKWNGKLKVNVNKLSNDNVWNASNGNVVLFPKQNVFSLLFIQREFLLSCHQYLFSNHRAFYLFQLAG